MADIFKSEREAWLKKAREAAKELLKTKDTITIDDVLQVCPRPRYLHRNTNGAVFDRDFMPVGFTKATHAAAKGRWVREWRLKGGNSI